MRPLAAVARVASRRPRASRCRGSPVLGSRAESRRALADRLALPRRADLPRRGYHAATCGSPVRRRRQARQPSHLSPRPRGDPFYLAPAPQRKIDDEAATTRHIVLYADIRLMVRDDRRYDRQAEPRAFLLGREVRLEQA